MMFRRRSTVPDPSQKTRLSFATGVTDYDRSRSVSITTNKSREWDTLFNNRMQNLSIKNPHLVRNALGHSILSDEIEEEGEEEEEVEEVNEIDVILSNWKRSHKKKKIFKNPRLPPPPPPPSVVPQEILEPDPEPDESEILYNLREFYLNPADLKSMPKSEKLFVYDPVERKMVGKLSISTETFDDKILITMEGTKTNDELEMRDVYFHLAWITNDFVPIKEFRSEQAWAPGEESFRSLHLMRFGDAGFHISAKRGCDGDEINESYFAKMKTLKRVLSEAAIFILMRKLISSLFIGTLKMRCLFTTGDICPTNIRVYRSQQMTLNDVNVDVVRIRRKVKCPSGIDEVTNTYFTTAGQYIAQVFKGERYRIQIDPMAVLNQYNFVNPERIVPLRCRYEDDPQVNSFYLDEIDRWTYKDKLYLADHPEVMHIISQLMKELLMNKPHRVVAFAQNYFTRML